MMMHQPIYHMEQRREPVVVLSPRIKMSRAARRRSVFGKQNVWDKMRGRLSPKETRQRGLYEG